MKGTRNMNELEMESENRDDPVIYAGRRDKVRVSEHSFNIFHINFNNKIAQSDEM